MTQPTIESREVMRDDEQNQIDPAPQDKHLTGWDDKSYEAHPEVPRDWVPSRAVAHTPPVVSPYGMVSHSPVVYAINPYKNTTCIAALVLGIATFFTFGFTGIPAVITGHLALTQCQKGAANQKGLAMTGLVLGYVAVIGWALWWLFILVSMVVGASSGSGS
jgi:hypothetical protein